MPTKPVANVYTSDSIAGTWVSRPYLRPTHCNWQLGGLGHAQFTWEYGRIKQPSGQDWETVEPLSVDGHWVMIQWTPEQEAAGLSTLSGGGLETIGGTPLTSMLSTQVWVGLVTGSQDAPHISVESGTQTLFAISPEILLQRILISKSWVVREVPIDGEDPQVAVDIVPYGIAFNAASDDGYGSAYAAANKSSKYLGFAPNMDRDKVAQWTAKEIIEYLIGFAVYESMQFGAFSVPEFSYDNFPLRYIPLNIETHGRSVYDILNSVIDRKRGLLWWLEPTIDYTQTPVRPRGFRLKIATISRFNIAISDTEAILANPRQRDLDLRDRSSVLDVSITADNLNKVQQVIVEGAPPTATFSIRHTAAGADWTGEEEQKYRIAAKALGDEYTFEDLSSKKTLNDHYRQSEAVKHVYTRFKLQLSAIRGGGYSEEEVKIFANDSNPGYTAGPSGFWSIFPDTTKPWGSEAAHTKKPSPYDPNQITVWEPGIRLCRETRLLPRVDYSVTTPVVSYDYATHEYVRPMLFYQDVSASRWHRLDTLGSYAAQDELKGSGGAVVSIGLRVHEHQFGFDLVPSDGVSHHLDRDGVYNGQDDVEVSHVKKGLLDTGDIIVMTLCATSGCPLRIVYPQEHDGYQFEQQVPMVIYLGERARLDWVVGGTKLAVKDDNTDLVESKYHILRDDRESMYVLARAAWSWYSQSRSAIQCSLREVVNYSPYAIGTLIRSVIVREADGFTFTLGRLDGVLIARLDSTLIRGYGEREPINTVISSVHIDWVRGVTSLATHFAEIDFQGIVG